MHIILKIIGINDFDFLCGSIHWVNVMGQEIALSVKEMWVINSGKGENRSGIPRELAVDENETTAPAQTARGSPHTAL